MLAHLIRKELLDHLLSLRFAMACIICPVVVLSSVFVLTRDYRDASLDFRTNRLMHADQLNDVRFPHLLTSEGVLVDKPLNPMKVFFSGVAEGRHTASVRISAVAAPEVQASFEKNPVGLLFPVMDLTFVAGIIMSLMAIAFSYDAFSGEKDSGTLKVVLSDSVARDLLLISKWIGGCLALSAPFLLSVVLGLLITLLFPEIDLRQADWLSLGLAVAGTLAYLSTIFALGLFVSARTAMPSTSITVLLLVWVVMVLVYPNLAPRVAGLVQPTPSMQSVEAEKSRLRDEEQGKFIHEWRAYIGPAQEAGTPVEELLAKYKELESEMAERATSGRKRIEADFQRSMDEQVSLTRMLAKVSPAALFTVAVCDFSGTGVQEKANFREQLQRYSATWTEYAYSKFDAAIYEGEAELDTEDYPRFDYVTLPFEDRLRDTSIDMLILLLWNAVFLLLAWTSVTRYDVT